MSDLLSLLSLGGAGITAQNTGVAVATNNVANANTAGYSRQRVDLESLLAAPLVGGVRAGRPDRLQDELLGSRIRSATGALSMARAYHDALLDTEQRLAGAGPAVHQQLGELFAGLGRVAASPTDSPTRIAVVGAARDLVAGIHRRAAELEAARAECNERIRTHVEEASVLAQELARTNLEIARSDDPVLRDERDRTAAKLTALVGGSARLDAKGQLRFVLDGGAVLVDGQHASTLATVADPATGDLRVEVASGGIRRDVTTAISGGALAAHLGARDGTIAQARGDLDQLAFDVATSLNATHTANAGLDGVSGRPMFAPLAGVAGAARALALDPALDADPDVLATAAIGAGPGDNRGARALLALADAPVATGGKTLAQSAIDLVARVGAEAGRAGRVAERDELVAEHLTALRDSLAGVDVQEELSNLARFEHASSAMTRFVSTIDGLLGELIDRL